MDVQRNLNVPGKIGRIVKGLHESVNLTRLNIYSTGKVKFYQGDKAEFTYGEARTTFSGIEIYALRSDVRLINSNTFIDVDSVFLRILHNGPSKLIVFFDTIGNWGKERIQFSFFMFKPEAFETLKTLIYKISTYKHKSCSEVFKIIGYEETPVDSLRNLVVNLYGPLKFYMVSYLHEFMPLLEPHLKYIGSYDGDVELLAGVIFNNVIINMGFLCKRIDFVENYDY